MKPYSAACENNKVPILAVLEVEFAGLGSVLEIGSGSGQHAVYFASHLAGLAWQTSDLSEHHAGINAWLDAANLPNLDRPLVLDVDIHPWPDFQFNGVFSANTLHIMGWSSVVNLFAGVGRMLNVPGVLAIYGPFNFDGAYSSDSNAEFDRYLRARDPRSGIRNFEDLNELAKLHQLEFLKDYAMPANNRMLIWEKRVKGEPIDFG